MRMKSYWQFVAMLAVLATGSLLWAGNPSATTITVEDMHCPSCAKKITAKVREVPGVATVRADVPASALIVGPQAGRSPSPRAMWEAVERAGYMPTRLQGPGGTFVAKPQSRCQNRTGDKSQEDRSQPTDGPDWDGPHGAAVRTDVSRTMGEAP